MNRRKRVEMASSKKPLTEKIVGNGLRTRKQKYIVSLFKNDIQIIQEYNMTTRVAIVVRR